ncbi:dipeptide ABC transporter ATP-binding protein [Basilea psittacipulmonis]|uniref:ABC transporter ATP-binding protein n=1 Tax=Basilea psittacipulmonis DSM 24701 TaxID=1072685 RepID=A0A077DDD2_9BURK|nr:ABC transporter ATP-binding protein [Basilea psittacipulmonis]AIL32850.1 ABC transporter ATP-binding protein [Basilea psittacipulmonis DSM 24701]
MNEQITHSPLLLEVKNLEVSYPTRHGTFHAIKHISFNLNRGEILGIVGESGAGKSTIGNAITGLLTPPGKVTSGEAYLDGQSLQTLDEETLRKIRGKDIGFIFQDPMTSLNPLLTIGEQLMEPMFIHLNLSKNEAYEKAIHLLNSVGINNPELRLTQYPHEFSGGMRQRVVIAIALSTDPKLIIADEPTTALDVSIQDQILQLIKKLCKEHDVGCILVTHNMGVVSKITDRVMVTYRGELMEIGPTHQVLTQPQHNYTKSLISAVPPSEKKIERFPLVSYIEEGATHQTLNISEHWLGTKTDEDIAVNYDDILQVNHINLKFCIQHSLLPQRRRYLHVVKDVSFHVAKGECFGLVGESGSGKSTIARMISGLYTPDSGQIIFEGTDLTSLKNEKARLPYRRAMQMIFQNPYSSLNPRMKVKDIIAEPILFHHLAKPDEVTKIVDTLIDYVGLSKLSGNKYPHEFSGGQRQRISIARALATRPRLLICDEPTSALDVSVQAQILNLLKDLQDELQLSMIFISHDLPVVRQMCHRIGVLKLGELVEVNDSDRIFEAPQNLYTQELINLIPRFDSRNSY